MGYGTSWDEPSEVRHIREIFDDRFNAHKQAIDDHAKADEDALRELRLAIDAVKSAKDKAAGAVWVIVLLVTGFGVWALTSFKETVRSAVTDALLQHGVIETVKQRGER